MRTKLLAAIFVLAGTILSSCGGGGYYVRYGPPAPRYGVRGYAPGAGYVWTDGYWDWRGGRWAWVEGRWMLPPRARAVWVPGGWHQENRGWRYHRGYWR